MPLHICFADYHSEMKFEQLLKIICKRYFVPLFFFVLFFCSLNHYSSPSPAPHLPACLSKQWYWPQCKHTHRAARKLIMFPKHIFGALSPLQGVEYLSFFCFHIVPLALKHWWCYLRLLSVWGFFKRWRGGKKKREMCVTSDAATTLTVKMLSRSQMGIFFG